MQPMKKILDIQTEQIQEKCVIEYILERFETVKKCKKMGELVNFQQMNKYMLMAHNQEDLKILGKLVANNKKMDIDFVLDKYEKHLISALKNKPTKKTNLNVIMHIFGNFSKHFSKPEKDLFFELVQKYKDECITLGQILSEIEPLIYRFNNTYLAQQTYFLLYANTRPGVLFAALRDN